MHLLVYISECEKLNAAAAPLRGLLECGACALQAALEGRESLPCAPKHYEILAPLRMVPTEIKTNFSAHIYCAVPERYLKKCAFSLHVRLKIT